MPILLYTDTESVRESSKISLSLFNIWGQCQCCGCIIGYIKHISKMAILSNNSFTISISPHFPSCKKTFFFVTIETIISQQLIRWPTDRKHWLATCCWLVIYTSYLLTVNCQCQLLYIDRFHLQLYIIIYNARTCNI